jgi:predicted RNase H-like HicB family nuclease
MKPDFDEAVITIYIEHDGDSCDAKKAIVSAIIEVELGTEDDGRSFASVLAIPGAMAYGQDPEDAIRQALAIAFRELGDRVLLREPPCEHLEATAPPAIETKGEG